MKTTNKNNKKCFIYARTACVSEDKPFDAINTQIALCKECASKAGYEVLGVFSDIGTEPLQAESELNEMLKVLKNIRVDAVIVQDITRFSRNVIHASSTMEKLSMRNVELVAVDTSKIELYPIILFNCI